MGSNWIESTVGEYLPFIYGKGLPKRERKSGNIPVYGSNGVVGYHSVAHVNKAGIIIGRKGSIGEIHLSKVPFWPIDTSFYVVKDSFNELLFAFYLLKNLGLDEKNTDSAIPGLNREYAHSLKIKIPETEEQRIKLGRWLYSFDKKIELNNQINDTLEAMAQAIFKSWFVDFDPVHAKAKAKADGLDEEGINRVAMAVIASKSDAELTKMKADSPAEYEQLKTLASLFPDQLEESELGLIPQGWEVRPLSEFGKIVCGKTPSKKKSEYYNGDIPFIKIPDMHGEVFITKTSEFLSQEGAKSQFKKEIPSNSVIVSCIATVGLVSITTEPSHTNQQINSIIPYKDYYAKYLFFKLRNSEKYLQDLASGGSATLNLNTGNFSKIEILKPRDELLKVFDMQNTAIFKRILLNNKEMQSLAELRDALLPKLLSGEIEV